MQRARLILSLTALIAAAAGAWALWPAPPYSLGPLPVYFSTFELVETPLYGRVDPRQLRLAPWLEPQRLVQVVGRDSIKSIDYPRFETVSQADAWLAPQDLVLALARGGEWRAYPLSILNWHEVVNDRFADGPVLISYCPLCRSGLAFLPPEALGDTPQFGVSGRLYRSDLVLYDRATGTFWSQLDGRPLAGALVGTVAQLEALPLEVARWDAWRQAHPQGRVLARPRWSDALGGWTGRMRLPPGQRVRTPFVNDYGRNPYAAYSADPADTFGAPWDDRRLPPKALVWGLDLPQGAKAYPETAFANGALVHDALGSLSVLGLRDPASGAVYFFEREVEGKVLTFSLQGERLRDAETGSDWMFSGEAVAGPLEGQRLRALPVQSAYWFAWVAFHPGTGLKHIP